MKSAFEIRTKIQPMLVEFWVAILAGPGRFLDEISFQNSSKNSIKFGLNFEKQFWQIQDASPCMPPACHLHAAAPVWRRTARPTCMPRCHLHAPTACRLHAAAPPAAALATARPTCMPPAPPACHLHAPPACRLHAHCMQLHPLRRRWPQHVPFFS